MELKVYRLDGSETGRTVTLDPSVFGIEPNKHAVWLDVRSIQAAARQGTHKTKGRSEVTGSTRKLYRQKGTGFARAGDAKSPTRKGGGTMFGPQPHKYTVNVNKKVKRLARRSALVFKQQADAIRVVEDFAWEKPSTRQMVGILKAFGVNKRGVLLLTAELQEMLYKSGRNIPGMVVRSAAGASTLDVMKARILFVQESALPVLSKALGTEQPATAE